MVLADPAGFLRDHWQKRPLLVRQALPGFCGIVSRDALLALAGRDDVVSRLVIEHPRRRSRSSRLSRLSRLSRWERHDGPLTGLSAAQLPDARWTVLVHGVESLVPGGWELLRQFSFIPAARIDDLMVSYAVDGGSVGAHDDLYDVFLLQGPGRRRWQVSRGGSRALDENASIKVLASFEPEEEWLLEPGDMLYLPPGVAHRGMAEGECFTYSIGFLAPSHADLIGSFLGYLGYALAPGREKLATVRDSRVPKEPLEIGDELVAKLAPVLDGIVWDRALVEEFLGCFLTRPKPQVRFFPPARPLSPEAFARRLAGRGQIALALPTRGLTRGGRLFLNGETHAASRATLQWFRKLVRERALPLPLSLDDRSLERLHAWYAAGYLELRR